jgi:hypothetical protein
MTGTDFFLKTIIAKHLPAHVSAACLHTNQSLSYLNHLVHITEYLFKSRTVEAKKQPLLGNARTQQ